MRTSLTRFGGLLPRQSDLNKDVSFADIAENVDLARGTLRPWRQPAKISETTGGAIYVDGCCVIAGGCHARFAEVGTGCGRIVVATGISHAPVFTSTCPPQWEPLGFPCRMAAPTVGVAPVKRREDFSLELRSYYYTVVNRLGWESAPSLPSEWLRVNSLDDVTVSGFAVPDNATAIRLYRAQTPLDFGVEQNDAAADAVYLLVDERPADTAIISDRVKVAGQACDTEDYDAPPADLREVRAWRDGRLAGLTGDHFRMSALGAPHAWPLKFTVACNDHPVALLTDEDIAYVLTDGRPVALVIHGDCGDGHPIEIREAAQALPCISRQSAAMHGGVALYASHAGLVAMQGNNAQIITRDYYTADQWQALRPHTMRGAVSDGVYYGATDTAFIRFDLPDDVFADAQTGAMTTLSLRPQALATSADGRLYLALTDGTYAWNAGDTTLPYRWRGKVQSTSGTVRMSAWRLRTTANVEVTHWLGTREIQRVQAGNHACRLPVGYAGEEWQVEIRGTGEVSEYMMATGIRELLR